eukprot:4364793-Prymnesium_polylepis.2
MANLRATTAGEPTTSSYRDSLQFVICALITLASAAAITGTYFALDDHLGHPSDFNTLIHREAVVC